MYVRVIIGHMLNLEKLFGLRSTLDLPEDENSVGLWNLINRITFALRILYNYVETSSANKRNSVVELDALIEQKIELFSLMLGGELSEVLPSEITGGTLHQILREVLQATKIIANEREWRLIASNKHISSGKNFSRNTSRSIAELRAEISDFPFIVQDWLFRREVAQEIYERNPQIAFVLLQFAKGYTTEQILRNLEIRYSDKAFAVYSTTLRTIADSGSFSSHSGLSFFARVPFAYYLQNGFDLTQQNPTTKVNSVLYKILSDEISDTDSNKVISRLKILIHLLPMIHNWAIDSGLIRNEEYCRDGVRISSESRARLYLVQFEEKNTLTPALKALMLAQIRGIPILRYSKEIQESIDFSYKTSTIKNAVSDALKVLMNLVLLAEDPENLTATELEMAIKRNPQAEVYKFFKLLEDDWPIRA